MTLSADFVRTILHYDPDSGRFTWLVPPNNHARLRGAEAGSTGTGYRLIKIDRKALKAHRLAWLYVHGVWPPARIDHKDGDPLNNRLSNLRLATQAQNCANAACRAGRDLPKGVRRNGGRFTARISFGGQLRTIGTFDAPDEAAAAYLSEARRLYGEFARAA